MIRNAYQLQNFQIVGGPDWLNTDRFDVTAKAPMQNPTMTVFLLFSAVLTWQLGGTARDVLVRLPAVTWGLAACFVLVTILTWRYFFVVPGIFATLIALCLVIAAWLTARG